MFHPTKLSECILCHYVVIQVGEYYSYLFKLGIYKCKSWCLNTHFVPNICDLYMLNGGKNGLKTTKVAISSVRIRIASQTLVHCFFFAGYILTVTSAVVRFKSITTATLGAHVGGTVIVIIGTRDTTSHNTAGWKKNIVVSHLVSVMVAWLVGGSDTANHFSCPSVPFSAFDKLYHTIFLF